VLPSDHANRPRWRRTGTFGSMSAMAIYGLKAPNGEIIAAS